MSIDSEPRQQTSSPRHRIFLMTSLLFVLCVAQGILTNLRDTVTLAACEGGISAIPFIQVWVLFPAALLTTLTFMRFSNWFGRERAIQFIIAGFLSYFLLFAFVLYPRLEEIRFTSAAALAGYLPAGMITTMEYWSVTLFYTTSDLWATTIVALFFWGIINEITSAREAEKLYGFLQLGATTSTLTAGVVANCLIQEVYSSWIPFGHTPWEQTLGKSALFVSFLGVTAILLFHKLCHNLPELPAQANRPKMSMRRSLGMIFQSKYLLSLGILVTGYSMVLLMSDLIWKEQVKQTLSTPNEMMTLMNDAIWVAGLLAVIGALASPWIIQRAGWTALALLSPAIITFSTLLFFGSFLFGERLAYHEFLGITNPKLFIVYAGAFQIGICKATRFSIGNTAKEIAFAALPQSKKWASKAAIDSVGNHFGKAGTAMLQQGSLILFGSVAACTPLFSLFIITILFAWIYSSFIAGKEYNQMVHEPATAALPPPEEEPSAKARATA